MVAEYLLTSELRICFIGILPTQDQVAAQTFIFHLTFQIFLSKHIYFYNEEKQ